MGRTLLRLATLAAACAAIGLSAGSSSATDAYPYTNDQATTTSVARWFYYGVTASQVTSYLNANAARLTQIRVVDPSVPTFAVSMVKNTGDYASGWYWWYGVSPSQLGTYLSNTNSRLISLDPYRVGGVLKFAAVSVPNAGVAARSWWWYYGVSAAQINSYLSANNARPVVLRSYMSGSTRVYAVVMIRNTGIDFKGWQWWGSQSISTIQSGLTANNERLISFSKDPAGNFDAIAVSSEGEGWYWYYGLTGSQVASNLGSHGTRLIDVSPYQSGGLKFTEVELDDSNVTQAPINTLSGNVQSYAQTHGWFGGRHGAIFKSTAGSTPAVAYNSNFRFEPASAIKVLYLLYTLKKVQAGLLSLSDPITYYYPTAVTNPNACPNPAWEIPADAHTTTIQDALNKMMQNSNNIMTRAFAIKWGLPAVQSMATSLGMSRTHLRQSRIGCGFQGGVRNELTAADVAKLYQAVQNGSALSGAARNTFWSTELGGSPSSTDAWGTVVSQEAASLGKSSVVPQFLAAMDVRSKGGSYAFCMTSSNTCNPYKADLAYAGRALIPFKRSGSIVKQAYVFADFVNDLLIPCAPGSGCTAEANAGGNLGKTVAEAARPTIHAALQTW
jgi:beta-lactamase family protein